MVSRQMEEGKGRNFGQEETSQNLVTAATVMTAAHEKKQTKQHFPGDKKIN